MKFLNRFWIRYWSPSSLLWRRIGDGCILLIPILEGAQFSNPVWQDYRTIAYVGLVIVKFMTNLSKSDAKN